jgi:hypothetical protein
VKEDRKTSVAGEDKDAGGGVEVCEWFDAGKLTVTTQQECEGIRGEKRQQGWHATAGRAREKKQQRDFRFERGRVGLDTKARQRERERDRSAQPASQCTASRPLDAH